LDRLPPRQGRQKRLGGSREPASRGGGDVNRFDASGIPAAAQLCAGLSELEFARGGVFTGVITSLIQFLQPAPPLPPTAPSPPRPPPPTGGARAGGPPAGARRPPPAASRCASGGFGRAGGRDFRLRPRSHFRVFPAARGPAREIRRFPEDRPVPAGNRGSGPTVPRHAPDTRARGAARRSRNGAFADRRFRLPTGRAAATPRCAAPAIAPARPGARSVRRASQTAAPVRHPSAAGR